jgi:aspartate racemase
MAIDYEGANPMKKIGIVGGVAWASTADYYSEICRRSEEWHLAMNGVSSIPEMSIESLDHCKAVSLLGIDEDDASWSQFDEYHRTALRRLEASGADFALIASNTPHHRLASIVKGIGIPVLSIFEVLARESVRLKAHQVLILGTALTMRSNKLREEFAKHGIEAAGPQDEAARATTIDLIENLQLGRFEGAAERLGSIAKVDIDKQFKSQPLVCLACTELPLAFPAHKTRTVFECDGVQYLNSTAAHIKAAFDFATQSSWVRVPSAPA